jgi:hypothetical protein
MTNRLSHFLCVMRSLALTIFKGVHIAYCMFIL